MTKQDIINYVMETPSNTNKAVLSSMLDSISGNIEFTTLFDDDINITDYSPGTQYGPPYGACFDELTTLASENGIVKVTYENVSAFGIYTKTSDITGFDLDMRVNILKTPVDNVRITDYTSSKSFAVTIYGESNKDAELEAYCQEPHHLKIEWFII